MGAKYSEPLASLVGSNGALPRAARRGIRFLLHASFTRARLIFAIAQFAGHRTPDHPYRPRGWAGCHPFSPTHGHPSLLATVVFSFKPVLKPFVARLPLGVLSDIWDGEICEQSTPSTRGAALSTILLKSLGIRATEAEVAAAAPSHMGGTEAWYLARYIRLRGLEARLLNGNGFEPNMATPCLLRVRLGTVGHFIPLLGQSEEKFIIGDPLSGKAILTREEPSERYHLTGHCMTVGKLTLPGK